VRRDAHCEQEVAGVAAVPAAPAEAAQADGLAVGDALRYHDVDLSPGRKRDALLRFLGDILERDGDLRREVFAAGGTRLAALRRAEAFAEEVGEDVLRPAAATAGRTAAALGTEREVEAVSLPAATAAAPKSLKALEARLALGIDLAAVKLGTFLRLAEDLVSGVRLGKLILGLRIVGVAVGVVRLRELAVGLLDLGLRRGT
jgi:hypothetical protein